MKHILVILLFAANSIRSMDDHIDHIILFAVSCLRSNDSDLYDQLRHIICNGTLTDFEQLEPAFRGSLSVGTIETAVKNWCDPRLKAIEKVKPMKANPAIEQLVQTIELLMSKEACYGRREELVKKYRQGTPDEKKAIQIVWHMMHSDISDFGGSIKIIRTQLEQKSDPETYLADEEYKVTTLKTILQQILDEEFEPQAEPEYDAELKVHVYKRRQRKGQLS